MEADDVGSCKLPTQTQEGRARCFCGAEIDIASMDGHVTAAHMTETAPLYSIATNQSAIAALFRVHEQLCRKSAAHAGRVSRLSRARRT